MSGIQIGDAALHLLQDTAVYGENGPTIWEATTALDHIKANTAELREAVAYLALQVHTYKRMSNRDAELAIMQIETIVSNFRNR